MINTIPTPEVWRQPRALVNISGTVLTPVSFEVDNNTFYSADTFKITLAMGQLTGGLTLDTLLADQQPTVEVFVGFPTDPTNFGTADLTSLIYGYADSVEVDWKARIVELSGRDLSSTMIDVKISKKWTNLTASQVVTQIASEHGLMPVVTTTSTKVGRFYEIDHIRLQDDRTEWDLVTWLAREEQFVVFVQGHSLYFQPPPDPSQDPYVFQVFQNGAVNGFDGVELKIEHGKTLAKGVKVNVHTWNAKQQKAFTKTSGSGTQVYDFTIPNLDSNQATLRAKQLVAEIAKHELKLSVEGPADLVLQRTDIIQLEGTGSLADTIYYPSSIHRSFRAAGGFTWNVEAKNKSAAVQGATA